MDTDGHGFTRTWTRRAVHQRGERHLEKNIRVYRCPSVVSFLQLPDLGSIGIQRKGAARLSPAAAVANSGQRVKLFLRRFAIGAAAAGDNRARGNSSQAATKFGH